MSFSEALSCSQSSCVGLSSCGAMASNADMLGSGSSQLAIADGSETHEENVAPAPAPQKRKRTATPPGASDAAPAPKKPKRLTKAEMWAAAGASTQKLAFGPPKKEVSQQSSLAATDTGSELAPVIVSQALLTDDESEVASGGQRLKQVGEMSGSSGGQASGNDGAVIGDEPGDLDELLRDIILAEACSPTNGAEGGLDDETADEPEVKKEHETPDEPEVKKKHETPGKTPRPTPGPSPRPIPRPAQLPVVGLEVPTMARQDKKIFCSKCKTEVDPLRAQITGKSSGSWRCNVCNTRIVQLNRAFGEWPPAEFHLLSDTEQSDFYKKVKACINSKKLIEETEICLERVYIEKHSLGCVGKYLPLSVYEKKGYDIDDIQRNCKDIKEHPVLGQTYRVGVISQEDISENSTRAIQALLAQGKRKKEETERVGRLWGSGGFE